MVVKLYSKGGAGMAFSRAGNIYIYRLQMTWLWGGGWDGMVLGRWMYS